MSNSFDLISAYITSVCVFVRRHIFLTATLQSSGDTFHIPASLRQCMCVVRWMLGGQGVPHSRWRAQAIYNEDVKHLTSQTCDAHYYTHGSCDKGGMAARPFPPSHRYIMTQTPSPPSSTTCHSCLCADHAPSLSIEVDTDTERSHSGGKVLSVRRVSPSWLGGMPWHMALPSEASEATSDDTRR